MILLPWLSIPSPSDPLIVELGIFKLRWYGTLIAIGILIAGWLASRELDRRGFPPGRAYTIATWCIPGGVIGARLSHVLENLGDFTRPDRSVWQNVVNVFNMRSGGLTYLPTAAFLMTTRP